MWLENDEGIIEKKVIGPGDFFNVIPPKKHRVIALTDLIMQEVSTPEVDDVITFHTPTSTETLTILTIHYESAPSSLI